MLGTLAGCQSSNKISGNKKVSENIEKEISADENGGTSADKKEENKTPQNEEKKMQ